MAGPRSSKQGTGGEGESRGKRAREELREKTREVYREAFLDAAERVFGERGFGGARMADIARAAGVATGTLYNYFKSKDEVFRSLVEMRADDFLVRVRTSIGQIEDPTARLTTLVRSSFAFLDEHTTMGAIFAELNAISESSIRRIGGSGVEERYAEWIRILEDTVHQAAEAGVIRRDVTPTALVAFLSGAMNGLERARLLAGEEAEFADNSTLAMELFLRGAGTSNE